MRRQLVLDSLVTSAVVRRIGEASSWGQIRGGNNHPVMRVLSDRKMRDIQLLHEAVHVDYFRNPRSGVKESCPVKLEKSELPGIIEEQIEYAIRMLSNTETDKVVTKYVAEYYCVAAARSTERWRYNTALCDHSVVIVERDLVAYLNTFLPLLRKHCFAQGSGCESALFIADSYCPASPFKLKSHTPAGLVGAKRLLNAMLLRVSAPTTTVAPALFQSELGMFGGNRKREREESSLKPPVNGGCGYRRNKR